MLGPYRQGRYENIKNFEALIITGGEPIRIIINILNYYRLLSNLPFKPTYLLFIIHKSLNSKETPPPLFFATLLTYSCKHYDGFKTVQLSERSSMPWK